MIKTGETAEAGDINKNINRYAVDAVGSDAYAITPSPAIEAYEAGMHFTFKAGTANTGACTLNVNGLGAKTIKKDATADLTTGDILQNQIVSVVYDGTYMQMISRNQVTPPISKGGIASKNLADVSGTVQTIAHGLGKVPSVVRMTVRNYNGSNNFTGDGIFNVSGNFFIWTLQNTMFGTSTAFGIAFSSANSQPTSSGQTGVITADATNIYITWTRNSTPSGTYSFMWEALA